MEENKQCADCRRKHPQWASLNIGVFLCIKCASGHRELGTHISLVKSTNLDKWKKCYVDKFPLINNKIANEYWEERIYCDAGVLEAIQDDDEKLKRFIVDKYQKKKYVDPKLESPMALLLEGKSIVIEEKQKVIAEEKVFLNKLKSIKISKDGAKPEYKPEIKTDNKISIDDFQFVDDPTTEEKSEEQKEDTKEEEPKGGLSSLKMNLKQIYSQTNQQKYQYQLYSPQAFIAPQFNFQQYGQYPVTPQAYLKKQNIGLGVINYQDLYNKGGDENTNYLNIKSEGYKY